MYRLNEPVELNRSWVQIKFVLCNARRVKIEMRCQHFLLVLTITKKKKKKTVYLVHKDHRTWIPKFDLQLLAITWSSQVISYWHWLYTPEKLERAPLNMPRLLHFCPPVEYTPSQILWSLTCNCPLTTHLLLAAVFEDLSPTSLTGRRIQFL